MNGRKYGVWAAALAAGLLAPAGAWAGNWFRCGPYADCPPPSYSCAHYWTPQLYRVYACLCGPKIGQYPPDRYPGIPPNADVYRFHCPPVAPSVMANQYFDRPPQPADTAPAPAAEGTETPAQPTPGNDTPQK